MGSLKETISEDLKKALKARDSERVSVLRMAHAEIVRKEIELGKKATGLSSEEEARVIPRMLKQRQESVEAFQAGGRPDLVQREQGEISVLKSYCPEPLNDGELQKIIKDVMMETQTGGQKDFGTLMKFVMQRVQGRVGGDRVRELVQQALKERE